MQAMHVFLFSNLSRVAALKLHQRPVALIVVLKCTPTVKFLMTKKQHTWQKKGEKLSKRYQQSHRKAAGVEIIFIEIVLFKSINAKIQKLTSATTV